MRTYDPYELISKTRALTGVDPPGAGEDERLALTGACMLLRGLGITPAADPLAHYTRILDSQPWPEADDQAGEEYRQRAAIADAPESRAGAALGGHSAGTLWFTDALPA
jgi:hypothetical protein